MTIITTKRDVAVRYLEYLEREIRMLAAHLGPRRTLAQLHWGGGTPTYFSSAQLTRLYGVLTDEFNLASDAEVAIEIDPRVTSREQLQALRTLGFNRLSMGVQDFAPDVQEAIGRRQPEALTRELYDYSRALGFTSINMDLVYGLPRQTLTSFSATLSAVAAMHPDRVAVYSYAHVPWLRPHQSRIDQAALPDRELKFDLIAAAIDIFGSAGYVSIGMDHFAVPGDELAIATRERRLHRNFMGYTTRPTADMVGVGVSAIGDLMGAFAQNVKKLPPYYAALDGGRLPIERGYVLSEDDRIRRHVITELMCNFRVSRADVEIRFGIDFERYFAAEIEALSGPDGARRDGFIDVNEEALEITPEGRLFVRNVCMQFDRYLPGHAGRPVFSRTI